MAVLSANFIATRLTGHFPDLERLSIPEIGCVALESLVGLLEAEIEKSRLRRRTELTHVG